MDPINLNNMPHSPRSQIYIWLFDNGLIHTEGWGQKPVPQNGALIWHPLWDKLILCSRRAEFNVGLSVFSQRCNPPFGCTFLFYQVF